MFFFFFFSSHARPLLCSTISRLPASARTQAEGPMQLLGRSVWPGGRRGNDQLAESVCSPPTERSSDCLQKAAGRTFLFFFLAFATLRECLKLIFHMKKKGKTGDGERPDGLKDLHVRRQKAERLFSLVHLLFFFFFVQKCGLCAQDRKRKKEKKNKTSCLQFGKRFRLLVSLLLVISASKEACRFALLLSW